MAVTGWKYPATFADGSGISGQDANETAAWSSVSSVAADDGTEALTAASLTTTVFSRVLRVSNFGFTTADIPAGSGIIGVEVEIDRRRASVSGAVDHKAFLVGNAATANVSARIGSNRATTTAWPATTSSAEIHGGPADLWDAVLTDALIRSTGFGFDLHVKGLTTTGISGAVDYIRMRVTYAPPIAGTASITEGADSSTGSSSYLPSLTLDFSTGSLPVGVTFARASTATFINAAGLIEIAAVNAPRFDYDPVSLACRGLLIEGSATNSVTNSGSLVDFNFGSRTANAATAPDGTMSASGLRSLPGDTRAGATAITFTGAPQDFSIHLKKDDATYTHFGPYGAAGFVALARIDWSAAGVPTGVVNNGSGKLTIKPHRDGWYRIDVAFTGPAGESGWVFLYPEGTGTGSSTGKGIFAWGAQIEDGAFATSYIPTGGGAVTRAADPPAMLGASFSDFFNPIEGTFLVEGDVLSVPQASQPVLVEVQGAATADAIYLYADNTEGVPTLSPVVGSVSQGDVADVGALIAANTTFRVAAAYKASDNALAVNGRPAATKATGTLPAVDRMYIGNRAGNARFLNGHVRRIRYYAQRLPNALLETLTKVITGSAAIAEANDNVGGAGQVKVQGQGAITEGADTASGSGEVGIHLATPRGRTAAVATSRISNRTAR